MSRSYKKPYTKSKAFDKSCRCHGGCRYCLGNRLHQHEKLPDLDEEYKLLKLEIDNDFEDLEVECEHPLLNAS